MERGTSLLSIQLLNQMVTPDKYDSLYIMISPTIRCNLSCKYCYVNQNMSRAYSDLTMSDIKFIYKWVYEYASLINIRRLQIEWFGGEPLIVGGDFLDEAISLQTDFFPVEEFEVHNTIQTNLLLADNPKNIGLFKKHFHSYVSGSMDYRGGMRVLKNGEDSTKIVLENISALQSKGISVGIVCTLTKSNIDYVDEIYDFFKSRTIDFRVNRAAHVDNNEIECSIISPEEYSNAVKRLFELYANDPNPRIRFANFDMMVRLYLMGLSDICVTATKPYLHLAFEAAGRLYSRCRFVDQIGDYLRETPCDILARLKERSSPRLAPQHCTECRFFDKTCMGACFGEKDVDCYHSDCGYRGETNKDLWEYLENYLTSQGYEYGSYRKD